MSRVIVSTDSFEIAEIAKQYGAEVPFMRPSNLSTSETPMIDVALHLIKELGNDISNNDAILTLQPTSPLRMPSDIDGSVALMTKQIAPAIVSVSECSDHPYLTYKIVNREIHGFISHGIRHPRRQDLPIAYALNGAIFLNSVKSLMTDKEYRPHGSIAWVMPRDRSVDIDDLDDFNEAERIIKITLAKKETGQ